MWIERTFGHLHTSFDLVAFLDKQASTGWDFILCLIDLVIGDDYCAILNPHPTPMTSDNFRVTPAGNQGSSFDLIAIFDLQSPVAWNGILVLNQLAIVDFNHARSVGDLWWMHRHRPRDLSDHRFTLGLLACLKELFHAW